jgi:hypothetical protein
VTLQVRNKMNPLRVTQFLAFLTKKDLRFRVAVLYYPMLVAGGGFLVWWLLRNQSIAESLFFSGSMFLLSCFVGLIERALRRRRD